MCGYILINIVCHYQTAAPLSHSISSFPCRHPRLPSFCVHNNTRKWSSAILVDVNRRQKRGRPGSGVATLGHTGARALATIEAVPAGAALMVALLITNQVLNGLEIERRSIAMYNTELRVSYAHHTRVCRERLTLRYGIWPQNRSGRL